MNDIEMLHNSSIEDMKKGYIEGPEYYECLLCGEKVEKGIIYQHEEFFCDAKKHMKIHIKKAHQSVFEYLIDQDKKTTGLSDHQSRMMRLFYEGKSDAEVQKELGIGSSSTIRNHRFVLKEKERQAKVFIVLMELFKERDKKSTGLIPPHKTARMVDDRYNVTMDEYEEILRKYFPKGFGGPLKTFSMKEKSKIVVLRHIVKRFETNRIYSEKEVNEIIKSIYEDFATIRRYLIEYGFLDRTPDCSKYWVKGDSPETEVESVDRKKELKQQYKEMKKEAGVYQIRNTENQKILVAATPDLKTINGKRFELSMGGHKNKQLQEEWNKYGEKAFVFEVLEVLDEKEDGFFDKKEELKKLEEKWCEKLQPYGYKGYNRK
ncbi:MAG: DUF2087 domain-containing protein [Bacillota bacterium]